MTDLVQMIRKKSGFVSGKAASPEMIEKAETELSLHFAADYKNYLLKLGLAGFEGHELTGITNSPRLSVVTVTNEGRALNPYVPSSYYVIEDTGIDGILIWQAPTGEIYQTEFNEEPHLICKSLSEYLEKV